MKTQVYNLTMDPNWKNHFYGNRVLKSPTDEFDCLAECFFIERGSCHFFVEENQICYFGNFDQLNGKALANVDLNNTRILFRKCNFISSKFISFLKLKF